MAPSWNCYLSYYKVQDYILMKTCAILASDALVSIPVTLQCCVKTRGQVQIHMPCPDTWQELQIYSIKHLVIACLKGRKSSCGQKFASLLAGFGSSNPQPWQDVHSVPGKWRCARSFSLWPKSVPEDCHGKKSKCFNQIQITHYQLTSPLCQFLSVK